METNYTERERYYQIQKKVVEIRKFYEHLAVYVVSNLILIVVNLTTSPGYLWFLWSLVPWGIAVILDGLRVFGYLPFFNKEWEERKIKEFMEKDKENLNWK
ncbi:2TM domain-containing protein [Flavobacterium sp. ANB]|uniref:2TM domain-containing protein n=1 Tax=unclassified Flavobacterium TaxID=196869 RepID=UPI0012B77205|nr:MULTISPECIES: 2TM domain-containing protein [unclassified Flavobacterium]MBF4517964.1 2TM domain-containing protein [Flavobacterium sp. ANB]MTD71292.1 histidine kinase [Flavobacterium sp. LC2016-13]